MKKLVSASLLAAGLALAGAVQAAPVTLLNVSYDVMRDFYKDYNAAFQKHWEAEHPNDKLTLQMSFGDSKKCVAINVPVFHCWSVTTRRFF